MACWQTDLPTHRWYFFTSPLSTYVTASFLWTPLWTDMPHCSPPSYSNIHIVSYRVCQSCWKRSYIQLNQGGDTFDNLRANTAGINSSFNRTSSASQSEEASLLLSVKHPLHCSVWETSQQTETILKESDIYLNVFEDTLQKSQQPIQEKIKHSTKSPVILVFQSHFLL